MPKHRLTNLRNRTKREALGFALATAGVVAVTASSAVSMADDNTPAVTAADPDPQAAEDPATIPLKADNAELAAEVAPVAQVAPAPAPEAAPAPVEHAQAIAAPLPAPMPAPAPEYPDNLDGWIREALDILAARGIPADYDSIHRNIMRESTGNPQAINLWDSNAAMGIPSKGLLQVIDPTFAAYHVEGTPFDIWDPVANIAAACNYAADKYGGMANVNSAY